MSFRRVATFATTTLVAVIVALAVPVSQLQMVSVIHHCCCPDPDDCHCPKPKTDHSTKTMGTCHGANDVVVAPQAPSFTAPVVAIADRPQVVAAAPSLPVLAPHDPPPPTRPDAPS